LQHFLAITAEQGGNGAHSKNDRDAKGFNQDARDDRQQLRSPGVALRLLTSLQERLLGLYYKPGNTSENINNILLYFLQDVLGYPSLLAGFWYLSIDWQCNAVLSLLIIVQDAILRRLPGLSRSAPSRFAGGLAVVGLPMLVAVLSLFVWTGAVAHEIYATYFFGIVFLGTLAGLAVAGRLPPAIFWAYVAATAVAAGAAVVQSRPHLAVALTAGVGIYLLARRQPSAASRADSLPLLGWLGRISYSLFLVHYPTIWAVTSVARGIGGEAAAASWPSLVAAVAASLVAAVLLHRLVEVPTLALVGLLKPRYARPVSLSR
jgi:peptidoglycan/LPS O-acetylase OafA/YrhL